MFQISRLTAIASSGVLALAMTGCATTSYPVSSAPTYPVSTYPVAGTEYGRVVNIEYLPAGSTASNSGILGAVVGGLAGAALGSTVGGGSGRTAATILGGVAGAAVGNNIARNQAGATMGPGYRITMQSDQGVMRTYEVPATGDLRVGDRVRVEGGVINRA
jgi:outer membrane lipoprotein SlyB